MSTAHLPRRAPQSRASAEEEAKANPVTLADLLKTLGNVPARRIRWVPTPGTATERDLIRNNDSTLRRATCELIEGTLVEKAMGFEESDVASLILIALGNFVYAHKLGMVLAPDGMYRLFPGLVRMPDVSYLARDRFPGGKRPKGPLAPMAPDLAVEVLSKGNTKKEMERKIREYFAAGTRLVWLVDHRKRVVRVYTSPSEFQTLQAADHLDGGDVLPGFRLPIRGLFERD